MKIISTITNIYLFYLIKLRRGKLKESLSKRKERSYPTCRECGLCCKSCVAYNQKTGLCNIWKDADYRCKSFPLFPFHLKIIGVEGKCRYYW